MDSSLFSVAILKLSIKWGINSNCPLFIISLSSGLASAYFSFCRYALAATAFAAHFVGRPGCACVAGNLLAAYSISATIKLSTAPSAFSFETDAGSNSVSSIIGI